MGTVFPRQQHHCRQTIFLTINRSLKPLITAGRQPHRSVSAPKLSNCYQRHVDAAALTFRGYLRNGFLHRTIREQGGAHGGGASQDCHTGAFRFFSYRDPRIEGTLNDFDQSIQWA